MEYTEYQRLFAPQVQASPFDSEAGKRAIDQQNAETNAAAGRGLQAAKDIAGLFKKDNTGSPQYTPGGTGLTPQESQDAWARESTDKIDFASHNPDAAANLPSSFPTPAPLPQTATQPGGDFWTYQSGFRSTVSPYQIDQNAGQNAIDRHNKSGQGAMGMIGSLLGSVIGG